MFFILSKLLTPLALPFTYVGLFLTLAVFRKSKRTRYLIWAFCLYLFFGNQFIINQVNDWWEIPLQSDEGHYDYGIVLGGAVMFDQSNNRARFNGNTDRLMQGLRLLQSGVVDTLIYTGGSGYVHLQHLKEAKIVSDYLDEINFPKDRILFEKESRNTYENALFTKQLLLERKVLPQKKSCLLITSSLHMRRGMACFEKQGFELMPYPTNKISGPHKIDLDYLFLPRVSAFGVWTHLIHEMVGYLAYDFKGYL